MSGSKESLPKGNENKHTKSTPSLEELAAMMKQMQIQMNELSTAMETTRKLLNTAQLQSLPSGHSNPKFGKPKAQKDSSSGDEDFLDRSIAALPNLEPFEFGDEDADWTTWVKQYVLITKGFLCPKTTKELHQLCLQMLPAYLNSAAFNIFENCKYQDDWPNLILELEESFEDPRIRQNWQTDFQAYRWDEKEPLHVYKGNVVRYVDKYEVDLRGLTKPLKKAYLSRFLAGLPVDYHNFVDQQLHDGDRTVENALKSAQKFQAVKQRRMKQEHTNRENQDLGASANFEKDTSRRLRALERKMEEIQSRRSVPLVHNYRQYRDFGTSRGGIFASSTHSSAPDRRDT